MSTRSRFLRASFDQSVPVLDPLCREPHSPVTALPTEGNVNGSYLAPSIERTRSLIFRRLTLREIRATPLFRSNDDSQFTLLTFASFLRICPGSSDWTRVVYVDPVHPKKKRAIRRRKAAYAKILIFLAALAFAAACSGCATKVAPYIPPTETKEIVRSAAKAKEGTVKADDGGTVKAYRHRVVLSKIQPPSLEPIRLPSLEKPSPFAQGLPNPSARYDIRLCRTAGQTLGELSDNLATALAHAGYTDYAIYPFQDGFAAITRFEQRDSKGNPSADRWPQIDQTALSLSSIFSWDYLRSLFLGKYGVFRFFIFTLTSESPGFSGKQATQAEAKQWLMTGPEKLPNDVRQVTVPYPFLFSAMVYEFSASSDKTSFVEQSKLTGLTELLGSKIVTNSKPDTVPKSLCFDSQTAYLGDSD